ncbi:MAG: hypothetical protein GXP10_06385 [Gammaproteobacteria bacterium]|nr:hypothetical protein [Gammaproteobacteria bacterium]
MKYQASRTLVTYALYAASILIGSSLLVACNGEQKKKEDEQAIRLVMEKRAEAVQTKNIELYRSLFSPEYNDAGVTLDFVIDNMRKGFDQYDTIKLDYSLSPITMRITSARIIHELRYHVSGRQKPILQRETLSLHKINGQWLIAGGVDAFLF